MTNDIKPPVAAPAGRKRFWKQVTIVPAGTGYAVELDGRPVKLPERTTLAVESNALAQALAEEWQAAGKEAGGLFRPEDLPLTRIAGSMLERIPKLMEDNLNRELLAKNSEIRALQNQINAHFIYNVLESIKMMAEIDEEYEISDAVTSLGKLLRYSMKWVSGNVKVEEELEYIKNYLALMNLRFDYRIILSLNIPPEILKQEIPKMSLQPIVENAIYHGIEEMAEDTTIYMKGIIQDKSCIIEITDAGKGMTEIEVANLQKKIAGEIETGGGAGNGIGLKNVQDRIHIAFGNQYGISIASKIDCYTKIMVKVPFQKKYMLSEPAYRK